MENRDSRFEIEKTRPQPRITPEGLRATGAADEELIPLNADERQLFARRIVAARCIYGVDKNPLAVELAKLSLWLVTLDKNRPFTFLDHALKCGDALVGADAEMFLRWTHSNKSAAMPLFDEQLRAQLDTARAKRRELEAFDVRDVRDAERKQALLDEANAALENIKVGCEIVVGARLMKLKEKEREQLLNRALLDFVAGKPLENERTRQAHDAARKVRAFHWFAEFPKVFLPSPDERRGAGDVSSRTRVGLSIMRDDTSGGEVRGGFDAFVGNPPFLGGKRIATVLGDNYAENLRLTFPSAKNTADLVAYFFVRTFQHLSKDGNVGLIATNTISQGETREAALDPILAHGGTIYAAIPSVLWTGTAAVYVSVIHIHNGHFKGTKILDDQRVDHISALLDATSASANPQTLVANSERSFIGVFIRGIGFVLSAEESNSLVQLNPRNQNVIRPYLVGEDVNSRPDQSPSRFVIDFTGFSIEEARSYPECFSIVRERVYPERQNVNQKDQRERWWLFANPRPELHQKIANRQRVLVRTRVTKTHAPVFLQNNMVFSDATVVLIFEDYANYAILQSSFHEHWAWRYGSTLKSDLRYSPTDVFETFPFPRSPISNLQSLDPIGETYHEHRRQVMLARQEGLTATYNRFHKPQETSADIQRLRELHVEMDNAVAAAYGWQDLELAHGFHETAQGLRFTIADEARRKVLARLLRLNHERWEEEERERGREGERETGRQGNRERGRQGDRERGRQGKRERGGGRRGKRGGSMRRGCFDSF